MNEPRYNFITRLVYERTLLILSALLVFGLLSTAWHLNNRHSVMLESMAVRNATLYSQTMAEFRSLYSSEVISRLESHDVEITHDYKTKDGAIPLPATLSMELGQRISKLHGEAKASLYSPYPFPWRAQTGGLQDEFQREAWVFLNDHPDQPFFRFEMVDARWSLRYATADQMLASCVSCHNTHPDSPKNNWQVGDVRGVLEIVHPMDIVVAENRSTIASAMAWLLFLSALGFLGLWLTFRSLSRSTNNLTQRTRALEREVADHHKSRQELRQKNTEITGALQREKELSMELQTAMQQYAVARKDAESANEAKSDFLANMSHEIRTPMTAILGFAENLLDKDQTETERLDCIGTIRCNGKYLLSIINDILDLSKIEAGKMMIEQKTCEPCSIVAEVVSLMRVRADAKGLPLDIQYVGAIPQTIQSDPTRLRQILINLISNAIKFTEVGYILLVTRFVDDGDTPLLCFDIIDTGNGLEQHQIATLFQPFTQADTSTTRKFGGTGLGLTISRRFAEMLGGNLSVTQTKIGVGTTFRVTVATGSLDGVKMLDDPKSATVVIQSPIDSTPIACKILHNVRVLFAEDGPDNQRLVSTFLKKAGANVMVQNNGKLALGAAIKARNEGKPFDVILMDMQMPVMDGYEATAQLRHNGFTIPIIALTAHAMAGNRSECIEAGCSDYATKPIDRAKLIAIVAKHARPNASAA